MEVNVIRKDLRIKHRIKRRYEKRMRKSRKYTFEYANKYSNYLISLSKCLKGVSWKHSTQQYYKSCISNTYNDMVSMKALNYPCKTGYRITKIFERGKEREITPVHIRQRVIQKVICDNILTPVIIDKLIYDNGASVKNKGTDFERKRLEKHLRSAVKEYGGNDFYILNFDFKNFFDSIPHATCQRVLEKYLEKDVVDITMKIIKAPYRARYYKEKRYDKINEINANASCGITLGSQVSQIIALLVPSELDHYIKDVKRIKYYVRYMDDGCVIARTKEELKDLLNEIKIICNKLGLTINEKKTHIVKARKGFTFLKHKYYITETGKLIKNMSRQSVVRMRRKLKKLHKKYLNKEIDFSAIYNSLNSWFAHSDYSKCKRTQRSMKKLCKELFHKSYKKKFKEECNVLQDNTRKKYHWHCI